MSKLAELKTQGFATLSGVYGPSDLLAARTHLDAALAATQTTADAWGIELVPLLSHAPAMSTHLTTLDTALATAFGPVRRLFEGARFTSLGTARFLPWHFHADRAGTDGRWDPERPGAPSAVERIIASCYVDGVAGGELFVYPRSEGAPYRAPQTDPSQAWEGQVELHPAPGDVVVWDVATFHAARHAGCTRRIFGAVYDLLARYRGA